MIDMKTGNVYNKIQTLRMDFSQAFFLNCEVNFLRVSKNIVEYVTEAGIQGPFTSTMLGCLQHLTYGNSFLKDNLNQFLREYADLYQVNV